MDDSSPFAIDPAIARYYAQAPEESRLEHGTSQLEAFRTRELIARHVPDPPGDVLDVGGGAGAYAFWLAARGYRVHLIDASPRLVQLARQKNAAAGATLASCGIGDARALPVADSSIDFMLLLGPLYHLVSGADRVLALREAARVLRPGGLVVAAAISRWASTLDGLSREFLGDPEFAGIVAAGLGTGQHRNPTGRLDYFTTAYFHRPEELRAEVDAAGLGVEALYGIEGPGWMLPDFDARWGDPRRREALLQGARMLEAEPAMLGSSAHLLVVGRKGGAPSP